jgi:hypothetical protein
MKENRVPLLRSIGRVMVTVLAAGATAMAQDPAAGGWRRAGDPATSPPEATASNTATAPGNEAQDPSQPVDRSDQYGQAPAAAPSPAPPAAPPQYRQAPPPNRPVYGLPAQLTLQPGTYITVRINQPLSSDRNQPGDPFTATLAQPIVVDGVVMANRGQSVYGRVALVEKHHGAAPSRLGLELTSLTLADGSQAPVKSQLVARQGPTTPGAVEAGTVVGTAAVGAAIGGAAAWGTGAAIGAGAGAAAGLAGVLLTRNHPSVVYPETALTFNIQSPVTVATGRAPQAFRYVGPEDYNSPAPRQTVQARPAGRYASPYYGYYPYPYVYPYEYWGPGVVFWGGGFHRGWRRW